MLTQRQFRAWPPVVVGTPARFLRSLWTRVGILSGTRDSRRPVLTGAPFFAANALDLPSSTPFQVKSAVNCGTVAGTKKTRWASLLCSSHKAANVPHKMRARCDHVWGGADAQDLAVRSLCDRISSGRRYRAIRDAEDRQAVGCYACGIGCLRGQPENLQGLQPLYARKWKSEWLPGRQLLQPDLREMSQGPSPQR
jgi:hypothetical protein